MVGNVNYLKMITMLMLGLLLSCGESNPNAYVIFIDYSASASIFDEQNENHVKIQALVLGLAAEMGREDLLEIYPIHAFTESATPVVRISGPELMGDLNDGMRRREWLENAVGPTVETIATVRFPRDRSAQTNIYPVAGKISSLKEAGYAVSAVLVCDLIQDDGSEDFAQIFGKSDGAAPVSLARAKVTELDLAGRLDGVKIDVLIPGSPSGNQKYDGMRPDVNAFWSEFFKLCGAEVLIRDL